MSLPKSRDFAVDVGCGSGQSIELLVPHFKKILGLDISEAQITEAKNQNKHGHVDYKLI